MQQSVDATHALDFRSCLKLFKPFLQSRERDDLTAVLVILYFIYSYDNPTKNHCSERDPPRLRSEHKFYGISLLINSYTIICIYQRLSRPVPVFAQIGTAGNQTDQAGHPSFHEPAQLFPVVFAHRDTAAFH